MLYTLAGSGVCGALSQPAWDEPHQLRPGGHKENIPTKTSFNLCQSVRSSSSLARHPFHVFLTVFLFRAFLPNLLSFVRAWSMVSRLFSACATILIKMVKLLWRISRPGGKFFKGKG